MDPETDWRSSCYRELTDKNTGAIAVRATRDTSSTLPRHFLDTSSTLPRHFLGALVSGWVADTFGRKPALFMSSATFALGSTLMSLA